MFFTDDHKRACKRQQIVLSRSVFICFAKLRTMHRFCSNAVKAASRPTTCSRSMTSTSQIRNGTALYQKEQTLEGFTSWMSSGALTRLTSQSMTTHDHQYLYRLKKAIDTKELVKGQVELERLQQGLCLDASGIAQAHTLAMRHAEDTVDIGHKHHTSAEGQEAVQMANKLGKIIGVPCHTYSVILKLMWEAPSISCNYHILDPDYMS
ncbi:hypothetical protein GOP47_0029118 [Adiantum capillus-veneris]|nr:hypothetical protein GOP47_0029118 [Adiantum capillus-veneris]